MQLLEKYVNQSIYKVVRITGRTVSGSTQLPEAQFLVPDWGGYSRLWHRVDYISPSQGLRIWPRTENPGVPPPPTELKEMSFLQTANRTT